MNYLLILLFAGNEKALLYFSEEKINARCPHPGANTHCRHMTGSINVHAAWSVHLYPAGTVEPRASRPDIGRRLAASGYDVKDRDKMSISDELGMKTWMGVILF